MRNEYETLSFERDGRVARVVFTRPERLNALNPAMRAELLEVLDTCEHGDTNVLVLAGSGRAFIAGVDLDSPYFMEHVDNDSVFAGTRLLGEQHELILALHRSSFVTIASINGDCVGGGGFGVAMACDLRFAVGDARFWLVPGRLNVVQDFGLTWSLQRAIGSSRALELALTGERVTADTGCEWGFINRAFADLDALDRHVAEVSATIAGIGPDAVRLLKSIVRNGETSALSDQLRLEAIANGLCFASPEFARAKDDMLRALGRDR